MKNFFTSLILLICMDSALTAQSVQHVVVMNNGSTEIGLIDTITSDQVYIYSADKKVTMQIELKSIYLIYSDLQKVFYYSPSILDHFDIIEKYGGYIILRDGKEYGYSSIKFDRRMNRPRTYLNVDTDSLYSVDFLEIHQARLDLSVMEQSVRNGAKTGLGLVLFKIVLGSVLDWRKETKGQNLTFRGHIGRLSSNTITNTNTILPGFSLLGLNKTGNQYQTLTATFPVLTMGWMAYDIYFDKRSHYIIPKSRDEIFPGSMYLFSFKRWYRTQLTKIITKIIDHD